MIRKTLLFILSLMIVVCAASFVLAQKSGQTVSIVGCYSDAELNKDEGVVVGSGTFTIKKVKGRYFAIFSELMSDGGASHPDERVRNLIVNEFKRFITFDFTLYSDGIKRLKNVTGKITRRGIKMNWRKQGTLFGSQDPFLVRKKC